MNRWGIITGDGTDIISGTGITGAMITDPFTIPVITIITTVPTLPDIQPGIIILKETMIPGISRGDQNPIQQAARTAFQGEMPRQAHRHR